MDLAVETPAAREYVHHAPIEYALGDRFGSRNDCRPQRGVAIACRCGRHANDDVSAVHWDIVGKPHATEQFWKPLRRYADRPRNVLRASCLLVQKAHSTAHRR